VILKWLFTNYVFVIILQSTVKLVSRAVPELNVWEGRAAASFFFTWVVGFLINKILWVVGDIKIKMSCLVGKLKPTQLICVVLQF
jgi:hypothetical protein